jgi:hypothetical protein
MSVLGESPLWGSLRPYASELKFYLYHDGLEQVSSSSIVNFQVDVQPLLSESYILADLVIRTLSGDIVFESEMDGSTLSSGQSTFELPENEESGLLNTKITIIQATGTINGKQYDLTANLELAHLKPCP